MTRADMDRAARTKQSADAIAQLAQMTKDFRASAGSRVEQIRAVLAALDADGHFLDQELVSHGARSPAATEIREAFSEAQRDDWRGRPFGN
jgi:hypothetical protein